MDSEQREKLKGNIIYGFSQMSTQEQLAILINGLKEMPDAEFDEWIENVRKLKPEDYGNYTGQKLANAVREIKKRNNITTENSGMNAIPIEFLSKNENNKLLSEISKSSPSDHIFLTRESDVAIQDLWLGHAEYYDEVPSDMFFANTVPLLDCNISVDERGAYPEGLICNYRVVIFHDYAQRIQEADENERILVGAVMSKLQEWFLISPLFICKGVNSMMCAGKLGYLNISEARKKWLEANMSQMDSMKQVVGVLQTWYGIQIALLHPLVKEVFQHPESERIYVPGNSAKKNKRKTKYVRKHVIKPDDIDKALHSRGYDRKTLVWYVIGHWRKYEDGRKIFVKPYWKGPLRELKQNMDEGRERIIEPGEEPGKDKE